MGGRWGHGVHVGGGGGGGGLWAGVGGCARQGDGGAVSSAAERHRAADGAEERPGLAKVGRGARGARGVGGAAVSGGARTPLGGDESCRASSHGGESWWRRGGAPRRPLAAEPDRDGPRRRDTGGAGRGWAPGLRGPGPWWLWAGAGETGRASGLRLVRGGRGRAGRARGRTPERPPGAGRGLLRAAVP